MAVNMSDYSSGGWGVKRKDVGSVSRWSFVLRTLSQLDGCSGGKHDTYWRWATRRIFVVLMDILFEW